MPQKIGFQYSGGDFETVPLEQINNNLEENLEEDKDTKLLSDFIPGAVYDGTGNILTKDSFDAKTKKIQAEARNLNIVALSKLILCSSLAASLLLLSYGIYKKHLTHKQNQIENVQQKQR